MSKIFTTNFRASVVARLIATRPLFYMCLGKHLPFASDTAPPTPQDRVSETYVGAYDDAIVGKSIQQTDMAHMIPRHDWTSGTGYQAYTDTSGDLFGNNFYVSVASASGYDVFKCLSNNGVTSTVAPNINATSPTDDIYETSDGYQWKLMYSIPQATFDKFATRDYIPVVANTAVIAAAVDGAIDYIDVAYGGSNYDGTANGTFQSVSVGGNTNIFTIESSASSNSSFYNGSAIKVTQGTGAGQMRTIVGYTVSGSTRTVTVDRPFDVLPSTTSTYDITPRVIVTGSGTEFQGRALVNTAASNSIYKVEIINRGRDYYYSTATVVGNTGGITNSAILTTITSPVGGHGYDAVRELGGKYLGLTATFNTADPEAAGKLVDSNSFRSVSLIAAPLLANVSLTYTGANGIFTVGDTITQQGTSANGTIVNDTGTSLTITGVLGNFLTGNSTVRYVTSSSGTKATVTAVYNNGSDALSGNTAYVNLTTRIGLGGVTGTIAQNDVVTMTGNVATSNARVYYANSTVAWLTNIRGPLSSVGGTLTSVTSGGTATVTSITPPDFVHGSGNIVYMENNSPINKASGQTETIKAIIEF